MDKYEITNSNVGKICKLRKLELIDMIILSSC